jgi:hypothetical protein
MNNLSSHLPAPTLSAGSARPGTLAVWGTAVIAVFLRIFVSKKHLASLPPSLF